MSSDTFELQPSQPPRPIVPIEPLYSMLHSEPLSSVEYLYNDLSRIDNDDKLNEVIPSLGITRSRAIEQAGLVIRQRKGIST